MLLWIGFALLSAAVVAAVVRPLFRSSAGALASADADIAVYRDQLAEIETDRERGLIGAAEAEAARAEVARRLIASAEAHPAQGQGSREGAVATAPRSALSSLGFVVAGAVPLAAIGLYLAIGSPGLPSQPHAPRTELSPEQASIADLISKVEARLRDQPQDGKGWDVLAPVYLMQQRYTDAADAFARAIRYLGESPKRLAGLGEAHVMAQNGIVNDTARLAYERLLAVDPSRIEARFWLALSKEQDGRRGEAAADYRALLALAPADAPWRATVEGRLAAISGAPVAEAGGAAGGGAGQTGTPADRVGDKGPSAEDMAAAEKMTPEQRTAMIRGMVDGLARRLAADGKDLGGWLRLVRAYAMLGQNGEAAAALASARKNFAGDALALTEITALARSLGLES